MSSSHSKDAYPRQVARMVAAELLKSKGVDSVQASCLEVLEDMLIRYMRELSRQSKLNAEVARRASINPLDVVLALQVQGVSWQELEHYRRSAPDVDFAQGVSEFPVHKKVSQAPSFAEMGTSLEGAGRQVSLATKIPEFFPAFPDVHSFVETEEYERGDKDVSAQMKAIVDQKEAIGEALVKLHERTKNAPGQADGGRGDHGAQDAPGRGDIKKEEHAGRDALEATEGDDGRPQATAMDVDGAGDKQTGQKDGPALEGAEANGTGEAGDNDENKNKQNEENKDKDEKDEAKDKPTLNPFLMPVKWEDKLPNATGDIVDLLRIEKEARLIMEKKRERNASVAHVGSDIRSGDVAQPNTIRTPVEFTGFTWIEGDYDQRRALAKSGARAPGVYDSGQGEHIQDKMQVETLLARNQGHEGERDIAMDAEEL